MHVDSSILAVMSRQTINFSHPNWHELLGMMKAFRRVNRQNVHESSVESWWTSAAKRRGDHA